MSQLRHELKEEYTAQPLRDVQGTVPEWLSGTLVRNGPAKFEAGGRSVFHWFDGLAMLHAFSFDQGAVTYSNRYLRTEAYAKAFKEGQIDYTGFATDPCRSLFKRVAALFFPHSDLIPNANVNVAKFCQEYVALTEVPLPVRFDIDTLKTLGVFDYADRLPKANIWNSAHPHVDERNQQIWNYYTDFGPRSHYQIYAMSQATGERQLRAKIPVETPSYMHSFALTENYIVLSEFPLIVNPLALLLSGKGFIQNYRWKPALGTRFTVISKKEGAVVCQPKAAACFGFHHVNAFELEGKLCVDLIAYSDAQIIADLAAYGSNHPVSLQPSQLMRFEIDLERSAVAQSVLCPHAFELPRIHPSMDGLPYRFMYAADLRNTGEQSRGIYKVDVHSKQASTWSEETCYPGEPIFLPRPHSSQEDDGLILAVVSSQAEQKSFLLILDALTMQERCRIYTPEIIPAGLHGQFF